MLRGRLEVANTREVAGWAWKEAIPDEPISIDIFVDNVRVTSLLADAYRQDLEQAGIGDGRHSFRFQYQTKLSPHERHVIRVCTTNDEMEDIELSPAIIEPLQTRDAILEGCVDGIGTRKITGWAFDPSKPDRPVSLLITDHDVLLGRVLANRFRKDLEQAEKGGGRCAFEFDLKKDLTPFESHEIRVRREVDGMDLTGSPATIEATHAMDAPTREFFAGLLAKAKTPGDISSAIDFMAGETVKLLRRLSELDAKQAERSGYRQFMSRWRRRLPDAEAAMETHSAPKPCLRALVIDDNVPKLDRDAGSHAIMSHILSLQRQGYEIVFIPAMEMRNELVQTEFLEGQGITCCRSPFYTSVEDVLSGQAGEFDVIYLHRIQNAAKYAELARTYCPKARLIYSIADLHHIRLARQAEVEDRPELRLMSLKLKRAEFIAAASADAVITHSAFEAGELAKYIPPANIHVIPWSVVPKPVQTPFQHRHDIAFIAGYGHQPNLDAAHRLISEIMPKVRERDPSIKCLLVGSGMPEGLMKLCQDGIEAIGYVEDLSSIFNRVRLTVAPLSFGAGVKGKVLESLSAGIPCVCTPIAAEGIALPMPLQAFVSDQADMIAAFIQHLHSDEAANDACRIAALDFIAASYSPAAIDSLIEKAIGSKPYSLRP